MDEQKRPYDSLEEPSSEARRELLIKVGRLSAYAVPASIAMLASKDSSARVGSGLG